MGVEFVGSSLQYRKYDDNTSSIYNIPDPSISRHYSWHWDQLSQLFFCFIDGKWIHSFYLKWHGGLFQFKKINIGRSNIHEEYLRNQFINHNDVGSSGLSIGTICEQIWFRDVTFGKKRLFDIRDPDEYDDDQWKSEVLTDLTKSRYLEFASFFSENYEPDLVTVYGGFYAKKIVCDSLIVTNFDVYNNASISSLNVKGQIVETEREGEIETRRKLVINNEPLNVDWTDVTDKPVGIDSFLTSNAVIDLGYITSNSVQEIGYITSNEVKDIGYITSNSVKEIGYITSNSVKDIGYITSNSVKEIGYITSNAVIDIGYITSNEVKEIGYITSNSVKEIGYITSNSVKDIGYITSNSVKEIGYITSNEVKDIGYITSNSVKEIGYITSNSVEDIGYITSNSVKEIGYITSNSVKEIGYITSNSVKDIGYITSNSVKDIGYITSNSVKDIGYITSNSVKDIGYVTSNVCRNIIDNYGVGTSLWTDNTSYIEYGNVKVYDDKITIGRAHIAPTIVGTTAVAVIGTSYMYAAFTTVGSGNSIQFSLNTVCDILVVGGGGGGGQFGGGGGAGGLVFGENIELSPGTYTITIGDGGAGATVHGSGVNGVNGQNTTFVGSGINIQANGGGGGGSRGTSARGTAGSTGGSGGGGSHSNGGGSTAGAPTNQDTYNTLPGWTGYGNNGGDGRPNISGNHPNHASGGGGGAGGDGSDYSTSTGGGNGGLGKDFSSYFTTAVGHDGWFCGGGGGNTYSGAGSPGFGNGGNGLKGGGGNGAFDGNSGTYNNIAAQNGIDGTGGGGGGSKYISPGNVGGKGGSGIVIIRWINSSVSQVATLDDVTGMSSNSVWNSSATDGTIYYTNEADAKVGIGKTNPSVALDVVGDVNITSKFKINGYDLSFSDLPGSLPWNKFPTITGGGDISLTADTGTIGSYNFTLNNALTPNAGTYGSSTQYPIITLDKKGRVTNCTLQTVSSGSFNISSSLIGRVILNDGTDGGTSRGLMLWTSSDPNWGIYMAHSGGGKSFSGGTACAGHGFTAHAVRFRTANSSTQGLIYENGSEQCRFSVRASDGLGYFAGGLKTEAQINCSELYNNGWFRNYGNTGLYNQDYGCHILRNDAWYGNWRMWGNNVNGWDGIRFSTNEISLMGGYQSGSTYDKTCGFHYNGIGWGLRIDGNRTVHLGGMTVAQTSSLQILNSWIRWYDEPWGAGSTNYVAVHGSLRCVSNGDLGILGKLVVSSDERIKYDIQDLNDNECLEIIRLLKPKKYKYREIEKQIDKEQEYTIGFIAQEVKQVLPDAISFDEKVNEIPSIQRPCTLSSNILEISNAKNVTLYNSSNIARESIYDYIPKINDTLILLDENNNKYHVNIDSINSSNSFNISYEDEISSSNLFAFGTKVNDFHTLDKHAIYTVSIGAIQELDRQILNLQAENALLNEKINTLSQYIFGSNNI
jgi:hypothetical protein